MSGLRSLLFAIFQIVFTPVWAVLCCALFFLPARQRFWVIKQWCAANVLAARLLCGIRYVVIGRENIPSTSHLILSKHSSTFETVALSGIFSPASFVAKRELLWLPFFGWAFALASPITINRSAGNQALQQMVDQGRDRLAKGFWIIIFPEGTRIKAGTRSKYKTGGARLAIGMDRPILPVAHNAGYLWPKGIWGKTAGTITISIGRPIPATGREPLELTAEVERWIEAEVERLGDPRSVPAPAAAA
ncbi:MAG: 1-acyl-sn-glycerol-3-phosphate acyltransferase [Burkholderiales bacterium]|nr:1-acyl-sn-glycerol-3-phosphate acyltransferase [Burkholderiales bacterium]